MAIQEIKDKDYTVQYNLELSTVDFIGLLSLGGPKEYAPIANILNKIAGDEPDQMTLNLRQLEFLNSSGISMLSKFVLKLRKKKGIQLVILGSNEMPWQGKSLKNLQKFLPSLKLEIE
ncbi:MAG: STAS domain-containing protein [Xenococcus sp. (in: cyanobacteria)]